MHSQKRLLKIAISLAMAATLLLSAIPAAATQVATPDSVTIAAITPATIMRYGAYTEFAVEVEYTLASADTGIIYLGFNSEKSSSFTLTDAAAVVKRGSGKVRLVASVTPTDWTANNGNSKYLNDLFNQYASGLIGGLIGDLFGGFIEDIFGDNFFSDLFETIFGEVAASFFDDIAAEIVNEAAQWLIPPDDQCFAAYVNLSEYPHDSSWTPLATDLYPYFGASQLPEINAVTDKISPGDPKLAPPSAPNTVWWCTHKKNDVVGEVAPFSDKLFDSPSRVYQRDLSYTAALLSASAYNADKKNLSTNYAPIANSRTYLDYFVRASLTNLGFTDIVTYNYYDDPKDVNYGIDNVAYAFGRKTIQVGGQSQSLVAVVVRGTYGPIENFLASSDWISDFNVLGMVQSGEGYHTGFNAATQKLMTNLSVYSQNYSTDKYFVTGHSRGAAVANLLSMKLHSDAGVPNDSIYAYCFATPDVALKDSADFVKGNFDNIHSICNVNDLVPKMPGILGGLAPVVKTLNKSFGIDFPLSNMIDTADGKRWDKYGNVGWFSSNDDAAYISLGVEHQPDIYIEYAKKSPVGGDPNAVHDAISLIQTIFCPVDVDVYDDTGTLAVRIRADKVTYPNGTRGAVAFVDGDSKYLIMTGEREFDVRVVATDAGELDYYSFTADAEKSKATENAAFENVKLAPGKTFNHSASLKTAKGAALLTLDANGNPAMSVNRDGTEIAYKPLTGSKPSRSDSSGGMLSPMMFALIALGGALLIASAVFLILRQRKRRSRAAAQRPRPPYGSPYGSGHGDDGFTDYRNAPHGSGSGGSSDYDDFNIGSSRGGGSNDSSDFW